ncbi:hypothetical protein D3C87_299970 [compost metagenome]
MKRKVLLTAFFSLALLGVWFFLRGGETPVASREFMSSSSEKIHKSESPKTEDTKARRSLPSPRTVSSSAEFPFEGRENRPPVLKNNRVAIPSPQELSESLLLAETSWKRWGRVSAVPRSEAAGSHVIGEVSGFALIASPQTGDETQFTEGQNLVYFNSRTQVAGIVTGVFRVTLKEGVRFEDLTEAYNLKITGAYPHLQTYFVTGQNSPFDLTVLQKRLSADSGVADLELEILSRKYEKN